MGYELIIFGVITFLMFTSGMARVFHHKPKKPLTEKGQTLAGLISLFLATIATYYLLQIGGVI